MNHMAIYALYSNVHSVDANGIARDIDGNQIEYDINLVDSWVDPEQYKHNRVKEYPPITDYLDGIVKGDQEQIQAYIDACNAVKAKYPKGN